MTSCPERSLARCLSIMAVLLAACRGVDSPDGSAQPVAESPAPTAVETPVPAAPPEQASPAIVYVARRTVEIPVPPSKQSFGQAIEVWYTRDHGQNWTKTGVFDLPGATVPFEASHDGSFGFILGCMTPQGTWSPSPRPGDAPEWRVVVDTTPPVVEVLSPNGGEVYASGKSTIVRWVAEDANMALAGLRVEVSGGNNAWVSVGKDLANSGKYHWDIGPITGSSFRVRVVAQDLAGNVGLDDSDVVFGVDGLAPDVRPVSPAVSAQDPAEVEWRGGDLGAAGLKRVTLYVTRDNGQTWDRYGDDDDLVSPFVFRELDGIYGLCLVAEDRMGNANAAPLPGAPPQHVILLDRTLPEVRLFSPTGGGYLGGVAVDVQWAAKDNVEIPENGIAFFYSADDGKNWQEIAREVKNDGLYKWTPPRTPGANYRFKIVASDFAGNAREVITDSFGIDTAAPEAVVLGPDRSGANTAQIQYEIKNRGNAPVRSVVLYYRPEGVGEWLKYGEDPDLESPFTFAKGDGRYGLYMVCATEQGLLTGFAQKVPDPDVEPQRVLTIDATPPMIHLMSFDAGGFHRSGSVATIVWKMEEPNPDAEGMEIYHSPDGGANWSLVASKADARRGEYGWEMPYFSGARHLLRLVATDAFGNRGQVESAAPFTIDDDLPRVAILEQPPAGARSGRVSVRYKAADPTSGISRVVLYGKPAEGNAPYKPLAESLDSEGVLEAEVAGEGVWAFLVAATDGAGQASGGHEAETKADFSCMFDTTPPVVHLRRWMLPNTKSTWVNSVREVEWKAEDKFSVADNIMARVDLSSDGGETWNVVMPRQLNIGKADLRELLAAGKMYRVRVVVMDEAGNEAEDVSGDFDPGEVSPPSLTLLGIDADRTYGVGSTQTVTWKSTDEGIREVTLELSKDKGRTWTDVCKAGTASLEFVLPEEEGQYLARVSGNDLLDRRAVSASVPFRTQFLEEYLRVSLAERVEAGGPVKVVIEPPHLLKMGVKVSLEFFNGRVWEAAVAVPGAEADVAAPAVPGDYVARFRATLAGGRELLSKEAKFKVVDTTAPVLALQTCDGGAVRSGMTEKIRWTIAEANPDSAGMSIQYSPDGGMTWSLVADKVDPAKGEYDWEVPKGSGIRNKVRLTAADRFGNKTQVESGRFFSIDDDLPRVSILQNPPTMIRTGRVVVRYRAVDATSGVAQVILYGRSAGGSGEYMTLGESKELEGDLEGEIPAEGPWEFTVTAVDLAGHASADVVQGTKAEFMCHLDSTAPVVELKRTALPDGRPTWLNSNWEVEWTAQDKVTASEKLVLRISTASKETRDWTLVVPQHPNTGKTDLRPYVHAGEVARVRVVAVDEAGNEGEDISGDFDPGDVPPPAMALKGLEENGSYPMGTELEFSWISTDATVKDATLEWSRDAGKTWEPAGKVARDGGNVALPLEEGAYLARLTATDFLNRIIVSNPVPFRAEITAEHLEVVAQGDAEAGTTAALPVKPEGAWMEKADVWGELYDGEKWTRSGEVKKGKWMLMVPAPPGERKVRMGLKLADGRELFSKEAVFHVVDTTPPVVKLQQAALPDGRAVWVNGNWELEWTAQDAVTPLDHLAAAVEMSQDQGKTWTPVVEMPAGATKAFLRDRLQAGTQVRMRVSVRDESGNKGEAVSGDFDPGDVVLATLSWSGIEAGKAYAPRVEVAISWKSTDPAVKEATLELSLDGGKTWASARSFGTDGGKMLLPREEGSYVARLAARSEGGEPVYSSEAPFRVVVGTESLVVHAPPAVSLGGSLHVKVGPTEIFDGGRKVRLELFDGRDWTKVRDLQQGDTELEAPGSPGEYAIRVVVTPVAGPEWISSETRFDVKKEVFTIRLMNFRGGDIMAGGRSRLIALRTNARLSDLVVEYSDASGQDESWKEVPRTDLEEFGGSFLWKRLPATTGANYRLRVRHASLSGIADASDTDFAIDSNPPKATVTGPLEESSIPVTLECSVEPSISPLREVTLYASADDGTTWTEQAKFAPGRAVVFRPPSPGDYGVYLAARSAAGLGGEPPAPGTAPQAVIRARGGEGKTPVVDEGDRTPAGPVTFTSTLPSKVKGGLPVTLSWSSSGAAGTATVSFVADGSKEVIEAGQPATGRMMWNVPKMDRKDCRIIVEVDGQSATSAVFEIDSSAPGVEDVEVQVGGR